MGRYPFPGPARPVGRPTGLTDSSDQELELENNKKELVHFSKSITCMYVTGRNRIILIPLFWVCGEFIVCCIILCMRRALGLVVTAGLTGVTGVTGVPGILPAMGMPKAPPAVARGKLGLDGGMEF